MGSNIKRTRTAVGIVFIIVNSLLSLTSFLAVYSAIYFVRDPNNYVIDTSSFVNGLGAPTPYIYLGQVQITNTGLFAFSDFNVTFSLAEKNGSIMALDWEIGTIEPGQVSTVPMNLTVAEGAFLNLTMSLDPLTWVDPMAKLVVGGKYAFRLFDFSIVLSNLTHFFGV